MSGWTNRGKMMERLVIEFVDEDEVSAYIDNQLPEGRVAAVEAYLRANPDYAARVADDRLISRTLRDCAIGAARTAVTDRLRDDLVRALQEARDIGRRQLRRRDAPGRDAPARAFVSTRLST